MNTIYPQPLDGTFNHSQVRVLILGESDKRFLIQLRMPVGNHPQGHRMSVKSNMAMLHDLVAIKACLFADSLEVSGIPQFTIGLTYNRF